MHSFSAASILRPSAEAISCSSLSRGLKIQGFSFKTPGILSIYITNGHPSLLGYSLLQHLISLQTIHCIQMSPNSGSTIIKIIHTGRARAISWMICLHCWPRANHFKNISGYQDLAALFTFNIHENTNVWTRFTKDTDRHIPRYPVGGTSSILRTFLGGTSQKTTLYVDAY